MEKQELKVLIKETLKEVIEQERHNLCQILKESEEELVNLTDWVKNGGKISQTSD
jgi:hypothetical protein